MNARPIIELKNAAIIYEEGTPLAFKALDDVSIAIYPEEYIIFFGPSGCGKSTLLYAISGLLPVSHGEITALGHDLSKLSHAQMVEFYRTAVGMVFQAYYLIQSLSVRANVALPQIFSRVPKKDRIRNAEGILGRFGILEQKGKYPSHLSGGQQQRVAVARALVNNPPIILADEPVGNLDSKSAESVLRLFQDLNERDKKTVIMVTHNSEHLHFAHRVFYMSDGKIVREVRNPKRQIRETLTSEPMKSHGLEELARLFPNLGEEALKAKMVSLYLLDQFDAVLEDRIEQLINAFIQDKLSKEAFIEQLSEPITTGGIGLYRQRAVEIAEELAGIVGVAQYTKAKLAKIPKDYIEYDQILTNIARYLLLATRTHPDEDEISCFKEALKGRLEGSLDKNAFEEMLQKSRHSGGAGFNVRTTRNLVRRLELLLLDYQVKIFKAEKTRPYPGTVLEPRFQEGWVITSPQVKHIDPAPPYNSQTK